MKYDTVSPGNPTAEPALRPLDKAAMLARLKRCLGMLDLVDSHMIAALGVYSTPIDFALEEVRSELGELIRLAGGSTHH